MNIFYIFLNDFTLFATLPIQRKKGGEGLAYLIEFMQNQKMEKA